MFYTFQYGNYLKGLDMTSLFSVYLLQAIPSSFLITKNEMQSTLSESSADLEGSRRDEGDVVVVQRERLERGEGAEGPL